MSVMPLSPRAVSGNACRSRVVPDSSCQDPVVENPTMYGAMRPSEFTPR